MPMMSEHRRAWLYRALLATMPLLTAYGVMAEDIAPLWIALLGQVLGFGMAATHTSTARPEG